MPFTFDNTSVSYMGILNFTPDSFSDGGKFFSVPNAVSHAHALLNDGADIIDLGAHSTKPGAVALTDNDELDRLKAIIPFLVKSITMPLSVDTFYESCALFALKSGAKIINDVSGKFNTEIAKMCMEYSAGYIVTHNPSNADTFEEYKDGVENAVKKQFIKFINSAEKIKFPLCSLSLDPGFGFGKSNEDNLRLLNNLDKIKAENISLLVGLSRKRFLSLIDIGTDDKDIKTKYADDIAISKGATIIRTHKILK